MSPNTHKSLSSLYSLAVYTFPLLLHQLSTVSAVPIETRSDVDAPIALAERDISYAGNGNKDTAKLVIVIGILILVTAIVIAAWYSIRVFMRKRAEQARNNTDSTNQATRTTPLEAIDLAPPSATYMKASRSSDTWERYLSMIQSPTKLNHAVKTMKSHNTGRWNKIKEGDKAENKIENA